MSAFRVFDDVCVPQFDTFKLPEAIMKDMMHLNLVDEAGCQLVARWMHSDRYQWLGLVTNGLVFQDEVFSSEFALSGHVVPKTDSRVIS